MPHTINGIGTWYWGKRHIHRENATCQFCGTFGQKTSYDTTLYIVLAFIPLIPLGQKRVFHECPKCKRFRVMPLKEWEAQKKKNVADLAAKIQANPHDIALQQESIYMMIGHQDVEGIRRVIDRLLRQPVHSAPLWIAVASGREFCGDLAGAEEALAQACALEDSLPNREALARIRIKRFHADEARPLLEHLIVQPSAEKIGLLLLLIEAYQVKGQHDKALALLDELAPRYPDVNKEKDFIALRKLSEKNRSTNRPTRAKYLVPPPAGHDKGNPLSTLFARYAGITVLALVLLSYLGSAASRGFFREVYLVNGLDRPYEVEFNGKRITLPPGQYSFVTTAEGKWSARILTPGIKSAPVEMTFRTPFLTRPFGKHLLVVNPDRAAVLIQEETFYAVNADAKAENAYDLLFGRDFYDFTRIDFAFQEFPKEISLKNSTERARRTRVALVQEYGPSALLAALNDKKGKEGAALYIKNHLLADPTQSEYLYYLPYICEPAQILEFVRPQLTERPVLVNWHRYYQMLQQAQTGREALFAEYERALAAEPDNSDLIYLLGRVTEPKDKAKELYQRAIEGDRPCAYAYNALAYEALAQAEYAAAYDHARHALKLLPSDLYFQGLEGEALAGLGRWDDLFERNNKAHLRNPLDPTYDVDAYRCLLMKQDPSAEAYRKRKLAELKTQVTPENFVAWENAFEMVAAYHRGDIQTYGKLGAASKKEQWAFASAICLEQDEQAAQLIADEKQSTVSRHLIVYLLAHRLGHESLATEELHRAVALLRKDRSTEAPVTADMLEGKYDYNTAAGLSMLPEEKAIFLTVLGTLDTTRTQDYFEQARRYQIFHAFPEHLLVAVAK